MTSNNRKGSADKTIPHTRLEDEEMIWENYEKGKKLGQGSFGKVYQVRHKATDHVWAMKFINKDKVSSKAILDMKDLLILSECSTFLKSITCPNIRKLWSTTSL